MKSDDAEETAAPLKVKAKPPGKDLGFKAGSATEIPLLPNLRTAQTARCNAHWQRQPKHYATANPAVSPTRIKGP